MSPFTGFTVPCFKTGNSKNGEDSQDGDVSRDFRTVFFKLKFYNKQCKNGRSVHLIFKALKNNTKNIGILILFFKRSFG